MSFDAIAALAAVRWEHGLAELTVGVADVLRRVSRLRCFELGTSSSAMRVETDASPIEVAPASIVPTLEWTTPVSGDSVRGAARIVRMPLPTRHADGYAILWLATTGKPALLESDRCAAVQATLGQLLDAHTLLGRVAALSRHAHADNRRLRRDLQMTLDVPARSVAMRRVLERADAVARYDTTVLVVGPSGVGKEVLARRIHARSSRSAGPFVQVNCGALPEALAESELFGHERGAFTGASTQHRGVFERATDGTLFLDEVGDLSLALQVKLLRVLQERTYTRVGGEVELRTHARVLAATHRPLGELVRAGRFREDLLYRLSVFPIEVPPLAERREDIPRLVDDLLRAVAKRLGVDVPRVTTRVMRRLVDYDWPGNVRELSNVLEAALITSPGDALVLSDGAPQSARLAIDATPRRHAAQTLEQATRVCIEDALAGAGGRIYGPGGAAQRLGLKPATLQSKMRKLGIRRAHYVRG